VSFANRYLGMTRIGKTRCAALAFTLALIAGAQAQVINPQTQNPKACANASGNSPNQTLSDKLDQSNGVICPPDVDPGMKTPAPNTGKMPVIPPPGAPGGNPNVQPK
jgi:hypothetical protein